MHVYIVFHTNTTILQYAVKKQPQKQEEKQFIFHV